MDLWILLILFGVYGWNMAIMVDHVSPTINLDDILNEDFMPMSVFESEKNKYLVNNEQLKTENFMDIQPLITGDIVDAYELMNFHRKMIHQYKCNKYMAKKILNDVAPYKLQQKFGYAHCDKNDIFDSKQCLSVRRGLSDAMLNDEGSESYKNWLSKMDLLNDIHQHILSNSSVSPPPFRRIDDSVSNDNDSDKPEYEEGTVRGYAFQHPAPSGFVLPNNHAIDLEYNLQQVADSKTATPPSVPSPIPYVPSPPQIVQNYQIESPNIPAIGPNGFVFHPHQSIPRYPYIFGPGSFPFISPELNGIPSYAFEAENQPNPLTEPESIVPNQLFEPNPNLIQSYAVPGFPQPYPFTNEDFQPNFYPTLHGVNVNYPLINTNLEIPIKIEEESKMGWRRPFHFIKEKIKSFFQHKKEKKKGYSSYDSNYDGYGVSDDRSGKEMTLKKVYELALTAIAYLAFGIFVLQVIMCITAVKSQTNMMMVMPSEMDPSAGVGDDDVEESRHKRRKRSTDLMVAEMNTVSQKVLESIEALFVAAHDNGNCLKQVLCENNQMNRSTMSSIPTIWMPVWGLGMSWLSAKLMKTENTLTFDCLKASMIGLGNGSCKQSFPCDPNLIQNIRKLKERSAVK